MVRLIIASIDCKHGRSFRTVAPDFALVASFCKPHKAGQLYDLENRSRDRLRTLIAP